MDSSLNCSNRPPEVTENLGRPIGAGRGEGRPVDTGCGTVSGKEDAAGGLPVDRALSPKAAGNRSRPPGIERLI